MSVLLKVGGQWSDLEPLSPRLVTGKSPAGYWSTVIGNLCMTIFMRMHGMCVCVYYVCTLRVLSAILRNVIGIEVSLHM